MGSSNSDLLSRGLLHRVCILAGYYPHHSAHSGYSQFVAYLPGVSAICYQFYDYAASRGGLSQRAVDLADRVSHRLKGACDRSLYRAQNLVQEARLYRRTIRSRERVFHLSYGEDQLRFLGRIRRPRPSRLVATFHQPPRVTFPLKRRQSWRCLDAAIAIAPNQIEPLSDLVGRDRVFLIPHGVDTVYWCPESGARSADARPVVLSVGQHWRDFKTMGTVARVLRQRWGGDLEFVLITGPEGARLAKQNGVRALVNVPEPELREWYRSASLTVLPLLDGTNNNAMLESLGCGTPVVASAVGVVPQMAEGGRGVTAVPPNDPDAMIDAVSALLDDPESARVSQLARKQAEALDWSYLAPTFVNVYRQLVE